MNRNNKLHIDGHKKGFVLVLTLFATVIFATLLIAFINTTSIDLNLVKNHMCSAKAYYIAEAGVADAIDRLQRGESTTPSWEESFPSGSSDTYNVSVSQDPIVITSTGLASASNFSRILEVTVSVSDGNVSISQWKETIAQ